MKRKIILISILIILSFTSLNKCERDDICIEGTAGTPNLIIRFFDANNINESKNVPFLVINKLDDDYLDYIRRYLIGNDSVSIPLKGSQDFTQLKFFYNWGGEDENIDTLKINHDRFDIYMNRACGFKGQFIFNENPIEGIGTENSWIKSYKIIKDSILNENSMHLALYH